VDRRDTREHGPVVDEYSLCREDYVSFSHTISKSQDEKTSAIVFRELGCKDKLPVVKPHMQGAIDSSPAPFARVIVFVKKISHVRLLVEKISHVRLLVFCWLLPGLSCV